MKFLSSAKPVLRRSILLASAVALITATVAWTQNAAEPLTGKAVRGANMALGTGSDYAADAGLRLSKEGGTAVDVGVAALFTAATTELSHLGLGGEAPILIRTKDGKVYSIAGIGPMPKLATAEMYRRRPIRPGEIDFRPDGKGLHGVIPNVGPMAAVVPGLVDAGLVALRDFGTKSFNQVIAPAIEDADGYVVDRVRASAFASGEPFFDLWPTSKAHFMPNGRTPQEGETFRQPDLARTLRAMANAEKTALAAGKSREEAIDAVRDYFYRGDVAREIGSFSRLNGGLLRYEDMAAFHADVEEPAATTYRGYHVYKPGFWSQGPVLLETLNILEGYNDKPALNSADYIHRQVEALKLAFADRDTYYGDPKFNDLNYAALLTKEYAAKRRKLIGDHASLQFQPGDVDGKTLPHPASENLAAYKIDDALIAHDTTSISVIDKDGIVFSSVPSGGWVPALIAGNTGIPLSQRAQGFVLVKGHPNELAGGKRPRVTLSPTLVTRPDGSPYMALSSPGADVQDQATLQVMLDAMEYGLNAQAAAENPRYQTRHLVSSLDNHAWNIGDLRLDERIPRSVAQELARRGHVIGFLSKYNSGAAPVLVQVLPDGAIEAGADPFYGRSTRAR